MAGGGSAYVFPSWGVRGEIAPRAYALTGRHGCGVCLGSAARPTCRSEKLNPVRTAVLVLGDKRLGV